MLRYGSRIKMDSKGKGKATMITFEKLNNLVKDEPKHPQLREGQHVFNTIAKNYPEIARELANTQVDCYFQDANITVFLIAAAGRIDLETSNGTPRTMPNL